MNLFNARTFYTLRGYEYIDVPTLVGADAINSTIPEESKVDTKPILPPDLYHVASGEQGFIELWLENLLPKDKKLQTITACQRPFDKDRGELYQEWFIKLELYNPDKNSFIDMLKDARDCYSMYFNVAPSALEVVSTPLGLDLFYNGIEIGSYGSRTLTFKDTVTYPVQKDAQDDGFYETTKTLSFSYGTGFVPFRLEKARLRKV